MQPSVNTGADMAENIGRRERAHGERDETNHNPTGTSRSHIQHGHEHGEEHERRAQIVLHDQHAHRHDPHHDDRPQILDARQLQAQHLLAADRKLVAVVIEVGGEEEREEQLREFAWLERSQTGNPHPNTGAILFGTDHRKHRRQQ